MSVLITGGAGFIASHLARLLLDKTPHSLLLFDNFNDYYDPRLKRENVRPLLKRDRVRLIEGDFRDSEFVQRLFSQHRPQYVIHLGAMPGVPYSLKRPELYVENNVGGTTSLLEAARRYPVERFLFASSSTVYGLGVEPPFCEDKPLGVAASPYGATKRSAELLGQTYHQLYGVAFTSLRLFNAYGPRIRPDLALSIFTERILRGEPITIYGDGTVRRDFTHVSDTCQGILAALEAPNIAGECLNLGHNAPVEVGQLVELIEEAAGRSAIIERKPPREGDMPFTCADLAKAQRLLGYNPVVPIEEGVSDYVEWARRRLEALAPASPVWPSLIAQ
jgi:UDP-glucuronate 4-epimerase